MDLNKDIIVYEFPDAKLSGSSITKEQDYTGSEIAGEKILSKICYESIFNGSTILDSLIFRSNFRSSEFTEADISNVKFIDSNISRCDFVLSVIKNCTFINCAFDNGEWRSTRFVSCTFKGCTFRNTTISLCVFSDCSFNSISSRNIIGRSKRYNIFGGSKFINLPLTKDYLQFSGRNLYGPVTDEDFEWFSDDPLIHISVSSTTKNHVEKEIFEHLLEAVNSLVIGKSGNSQVKAGYISSIAEHWVESRKISILASIIIVNHILESIRLSAGGTMSVEMIGMAIKLKMVIEEYVKSIYYDAHEIEKKVTLNKKSLVLITIPSDLSYQEGMSLVGQVMEISEQPDSNITVKSVRKGSLIIELTVAASSLSAFLVSLGIVLKSMRFLISESDKIIEQIQSIGDVSAQSNEEAGRGIQKTRQLLDAESDSLMEGIYNKVSSKEMKDFIKDYGATVCVFVDER